MPWGKQMEHVVAGYIQCGKIGIGFTRNNMVSDRVTRAKVK